MVRDDIAGVPDGGTLRHLPSGLEIKRRIKHEPKDLLGLSRNEAIRETDDRRGSKFLADWPLDRLTDWIEQTIVAEGWR